jgi:NAD(P)-dependent dehydrogenase (short-subunit alcohol dehydrogenase family)
MHDNVVFITGGARVLTAVADVRDLPAMQAAAATAVERFGGIDVVVANAGIASYGSVLQVDPEAFKRATLGGPRPLAQAGAVHRGRRTPHPQYHC